MIKTPTVLVLGAGASQPYNFPVGSVYKQAILTMLSDESEVVWSQLQVSREARKEVYDYFNISPIQSIDLWLQHCYRDDQDQDRKERFLKIGKIAIALVILRTEQRSANLGFVANDPSKPNVRNWFNSFWPYIDAPLDQFNENKLSVITFNYDRAFEYLLYNALKSSGLPSDENVSDCLSKFRLYHVYGIVAPPHFHSGESGIGFGKFEATASIDRATESIRIVGERDGVYDRLESEGPHEWLDSAERIVFLGFGFDELNIELLKLRELALNGSKLIVATNFGMKQAKMDQVTQNVGRKLGFGGILQDALDFMEENGHTFFG